MSEEQQTLPKGWVNVELEQLVPFPKQTIVDGPFGSNLKASEYQESGIPIIRLQNIGRGYFKNKNIKYVSVQKAEQLKRHSFIAGDIAVTKLGAPLGEATIIPPELKNGIIVADVVRIRIDERFIDKAYLTYAINSPSVARQFTKHTKGTTRPRVNLKHIRTLLIPSAPLNEQKRIVDKIERLFSDLDKGEENLRQAQRRLATYRQSVLKAAVTGELTRDWREANKHRLESGEALLQRILKTRREEWKGRGKYSEPTPPDTTNLPKLPHGWVWSIGEQLFTWSSGKFLPAKSMRDGNIPVYGGNGINGYHNSQLITYDTLVIGRVGAHCGNVHIAKGQSWITDNAIFAQQMPLDCEVKYLQVIFSQEDLGQKSKGGAQPFVNQEALNSTLIPLPSIEEQKKIVDSIELIESEIANTFEIIESQLERSATLRQSILKSAFSGKLVPQDATDEPASELLGRIQSERGSAAAKPKATAKRGRKSKQEAA